ncbi:hypothetical protein RJG79_08155 [Mycoplasmatota bacterium WC44]
MLEEFVSNDFQEKASKLSKAIIADAPCGRRLKKKKKLLKKQIRII